MGKYFTIKELCRSTTAEREGISNEPSPEVVANLEFLTETILDPLRAAWGKPIRVNSGYRCPELNKAVGGSKTSQHMLGCAADITTGNTADNKRLGDLFQSLNLDFDQIIYEKVDKYGRPVWLHIGVSRTRPNRKMVRTFK